jgi:hypothetical protein
MKVRTSMVQMGWRPRNLRNKNRESRSQTPGKSKDAIRCQLTPIAGQPRKFWMRARAYKHKNYGIYLAAMDKLF